MAGLWGVEGGQSTLRSSRCASPQILGAGELLGMEFEGEFPLQDRKAAGERWPVCLSSRGGGGDEDQKSALASGGTFLLAGV